MNKIIGIAAVMLLVVALNVRAHCNSDFAADVINAGSSTNTGATTPSDNDEAINLGLVEEKPFFPGGDAEMMKWLSSNINYPPAAAEEGVSGKVTVRFIVEKDGSISNVEVLRGKHPALDAEAVRVIKKMPKWNPGRNNGQPVRVAYMLPVTFRAQ